MTYRILIVEDDNTIREQLKNLLTGNGYMAAAVEDFSDVIGQVKDFSPHLVLLDIRLPGRTDLRCVPESGLFPIFPSSLLPAAIRIWTS